MLLIDASEPWIITMRCSGIYSTEYIFLSGSQLTTCIHRPYCIVHVYVVNQFVWTCGFYFLCGSKSKYIFSCLFISVLSLEIQYQSGIQIQITCLTPPYFVHACSKHGPELSTPYVVVCLLCVQFIHVSDGCSFCW